MRKSIGAVEKMSALIPSYKG